MIDEQKEFLESLQEIWSKYPELTFGNLVMQIYCGFNTYFSHLSFTRFPMEGWQKSIEAILETENEQTK